MVRSMDDKLTPVLYEPLLETIATWSLEFQAAQAVIFTQQSGNEIRVIGSRLWQLGSLGEAFTEARGYPWFKAVRLHVIPKDADGVLTDLFSQAGLTAEQAPDYPRPQAVAITRELFPILRIDPTNNADLIESLKEYRLQQRDDDTFSEHPELTQAAYLTRALELFACWNHRNGSRRGRDTNAVRIYREKRRMLAYG